MFVYEKDVALLALAFVACSPKYNFDYLYMDTMQPGSIVDSLYRRYNIHQVEEMRGVYLSSDSIVDETITTTYTRNDTTWVITKGKDFVRMRIESKK